MTKVMLSAQVPSDTPWRRRVIDRGLIELARVLRDEFANHFKMAELRLRCPAVCRV